MVRGALVLLLVGCGAVQRGPTSEERAQLEQGGARLLRCEETSFAPILVGFSRRPHALTDDYAQKISYRAVAIEKLPSAKLAMMLSGATKLVVAIDVAKLKMMAGFGPEDGTVTRLVRFDAILGPQRKYYGA